MENGSSRPAPPGIEGAWAGEERVPPCVAENPLNPLYLIETFSPESLGDRPAHGRLQSRGFDGLGQIVAAVDGLLGQLDQVRLDLGAVLARLLFRSFQKGLDAASHESRPRGARDTARGRGRPVVGLSGSTDHCAALSSARNNPHGLVRKRPSE